MKRCNDVDRKLVLFHLTFNLIVFNFNYSLLEFKLGKYSKVKVDINGISVSFSHYLT